MKRILLAAILCALAAPVSAAERRYTVTDFDRVHVEGPFQVVLRTGKSPSARAIGSNAAVDRVSIDVQGRTLKVRPNRSAWGGYPNEGGGPVEIELSTHDLRSATVTGSGSLAVDKVKAMRFDLALSGSGQLSIADVEADNLVLAMVGAGNMSVGGKVKEFRATVQGSGNLDGSNLVAEDLQLSADTSGTVGLSARRTAKVTSIGHGDTVVSGAAACTVKVLGSGRVRCGK